MSIQFYSDGGRNLQISALTVLIRIKHIQFNSFEYTEKYLYGLSELCTADK